jgi:hypothetical protein
VNLNELHQRVESGQFPFIDCKKDGLSPVHLVPSLNDGAALTVMCAVCSCTQQYTSVRWLSRTEASDGGWEIRSSVEASHYSEAAGRSEWVM